MDSASRSLSSDSLLLPPLTRSSGDDQNVSNHLHSSQRSYGTTATLPFSRNTSSSSFTSFVNNSRLLDHSTRSDASFSGHSHTDQRQDSILPTRTTRLEHCAQDIDRLRVYRAAEEAGLFSFGIIAVDVWCIDANVAGGVLRRTSQINRGQILHSVLWTSPLYCQQNTSEALDRLVDPTHQRYVEASPQVAGVGLAGYFLSLGTANDCGSLIWRNLHDITSDPLQPPYERMVVFEEAGFGKVTGVPFEIPGGHHGIVLYFARETADENMLNETSNVQFLRMATQHIGTASAMARPRQASVQLKWQRSRAVLGRVKTKWSCFRAFMTLPGSPKYRGRDGPRSVDRRDSYQRSFFKFQRTPSDSVLGKSIREVVVKPWIACTEIIIDTIRSWSMCLKDGAKYRVLSVVDKSRGGAIHPPPSLPWINAIWTFVGVFSTLTALVGFCNLLSSRFFSLLSDGKLVLAPFGALLTLQFSLTAAPASQPRAILYGQCICLGTTLLCQYVLLDCLAWSSTKVLPLAVGIGVASMTKLGIAHPPAAAAMVAMLDHYRPGVTTFSSSAMSAALVLVANLMAIGSSIVINNLSEQRQYPVYWAMDAGWPVGIWSWIPSFWKRRYGDNSKPLETLPLVASKMIS